MGDDFTNAPGDMTMAELMIAAQTSLEGGEDGFQVTPLVDSPNLHEAVDLSPLPPDFGESVLHSPCSTCGDIGENWVCLKTRLTYCSRYRSGCAVKHFEANPSSFCIHLSLSDLSVWDHDLDAYLDVFNIPTLQPAFAAVHLAKFKAPASFPTLTMAIDLAEMSDGDDDEKKPAAKAT
jgi:hypothetical protein